MYKKNKFSHQLFNTSINFIIQIAFNDCKYRSMKTPEKLLNIITNCQYQSNSKYSSIAPMAEQKSLK